MADFTSDIWSWFIALTTIISIVVLFIMVFILSSGKKPTDKDGNVETMGHVWDENLEEYNNPLPRWWLYMFIVTLVWGCAYLIFYPGLGAYAGVGEWTSKGQYENEKAQADEKYSPIFEQYHNTDMKQLVGNADAMEIGERLYASYCTQCHGSDARGARGYPNLRDDDWLYGGEPDNIYKTIVNGRKAAMPAWADLLSNEDIFNVVSYVESMSGRTVDGKHAALGKDIYNTNCAICHGGDGKGNYMFGAPNLTDDIWLYGGSQKKITESVVKGRNGIMPAHKEFLGEAKIHILSAYIYSLSNETN